MARVHAPTQRVADILLFVAARDHPVTLSEISSGVRSPVSTTCTIVKALAQTGFLEYDPPCRGYRLGFALYAAGSAYEASHPLLRAIVDEMHRAMSACGEICEFGVLDGTDVVYVAKVEPPDPARVVSRVGGRLPACCTATGRALLCDSTEGDLHRLYGTTLPTITPLGITDFGRLARELAAIRAGAVSHNMGGSTMGATSLALPVRGRGKVVAACCVLIPALNPEPARRERAVAELTRLRDQVERLMGAQGESLSAIIDSWRHAAAIRSPQPDRDGGQIP